MTTQQKFAARRAEPKGSSEFWGNRQPKCPHCGHDLDIAEHERWGLYEEGEHETECPACDLGYTVSVRVSYSYSTESQEDA